ncbi:DUF4350 domain-containing protein [Actinotalea sp. K2]|uniref:DUF4350 domain-containing protein n=1 Tax=Actinotalea sp. K2 TaxID=2939438 RepID=UPI0020177A2A|nr:DUF4350 domain-containing protein [Actinotalea sp. K2]MCL3862674.1 DUF4350 domain-containing protein [Actinotalea sp. K2]
MSSAPVITTHGPAVVGDGTTAASRARSRWVRARWPLAVLGAVLVLGLAASLFTPRTSTRPFAPDNPADQGGRALARILERQGVEVSYVQTSAEAAALAQEGTTLLVVTTFLLEPDQLDALAATRADLVLVAPEWNGLSALTDAVDLGFTSDASTLREASCTDPDAQAAGRLRSQGQDLIALSPAATLCFPSGEGGGAYASVEGPRRVVVVNDSGLLTNDRLAQDGNAALMLRALGAHDRLTWYLPSLTDTGADPQPSVGELLPPWTGPLALQLVAATLALALWRGRALGRLVGEPLPVVVRAAEATRGRGRLYRRSRSRGHAAAALRAGVAHRTAARLGLPRSADAGAVIDALARATGRTTGQVADLLYGPPPTDDAGLLQLARLLDELESEVHRT